MRRFIFGSALFFFLALAVRGQTQPPSSFVDNFDQPVLDSAWQLHPGSGQISLTASPGFLRYVLGAPQFNSNATDDTNSLWVFRQFSGDSWTLETKVTYSLPTNENGRQMLVRIPFPDTSGRNINEVRWWRDVDCCGPRNRIVIDFTDNGQLFTGAILSPNAADTYVIRIIRNQQALDVQVSSDGTTFSSVAQYTYVTPLPSLQDVVLSSANFCCTGYADYDYVTVSGNSVSGNAGCPASAPTGSTIDFTDRAAFVAATNNLARIGFAGILPPGAPFGGHSQLDVPGVSFSTPIAGTFVNVTTAGYYSPNVYPADFIVNSVNQTTGQPNTNNALCISLGQPTFAIALDVGGLGFSGASSGTITLSNGHVFSMATLPSVGNTTFVGFISTQQISSLTFTTTNDSWVVEDVVTATPILNNCTLSLAPAAAKFPAQGGVGSFQVITGSSCSWNPIFNSPWISPPIVFPRGLVGPATVQFWVSANPTANPRIGTISVGSQTFTVNQDGLSCSASLNPSAVVIDAASQSVRIVVTDGPGCSWSAISNASWLTITSSTTGTGSASVYIQAAPNSVGARTGTVSIAGQTLTVHQSAPVQNACGATDVTSAVAPISLGQRVALLYSPNVYSQDIIIINRTSSALSGPLWLVLVGVPNHQPSPFDVGFYHPADGQTTCFDPAGSGMFLISGGLPSGQQVRIIPNFFVDIGATLSYTPKLLSGTPSR